MLDTNTLIYVLNARPHHQAVLDRFNDEEPQNLVVSSITLAELRFGIAKNQRREATQKNLLRVLDHVNTLPFDEQAAETYGGVRASLEAKGSSIGPLDTLIAAHALSRSLALVTNNTREFSKVAGLRLENWIPA
jgi:tRNA(fMet)-specific endonuclease VapC